MWNAYGESVLIALNCRPYIADNSTLMKLLNNLRGMGLFWRCLVLSNM